MTAVLLFAFSLSYSQWSNDPTVNTPVCIAGGGQNYPEIVSDGRGGAIITWMDGCTFSSSNWDVYVQRLDVTGTPVWPQNGVALCTAGDGQFYPKIVADSIGGAIIAWWDKRDGVNFDLYVQRIDSCGNVQWMTDGIPICTAAGDQKIQLWPAMGPMVRSSPGKISATDKIGIFMQLISMLQATQSGRRMG